MKNTKRRFEYFSFFDHTGISRHLEKMAAKGWMLDDTGRFFWTYRRTEPKKVRFAVSYYHKASHLDPEPVEGQRDFWEFCAHTGWELICTKGQMQIFCNERENPVPIQTEPAYELESIQNSAKKEFLPVRLITVLLWLLNLRVDCSEIREDPIATLSVPGSIAGLLLDCALILIAAAELISFFLWLWKAKRAVKQGIFAESFKMLFVRVLGTVLTAGVFGMFAYENFCSGNPRDGILMLWVVAIAILMTVCIFGVSSALKAMKATKGANLFFSTATAVVLMFVLFIGMSIAGINGAFDKPVTNPGCPETAFFYEEELPLKMDDLTEVYPGEYLQRPNVRESVLLGRYYAEHEKRVTLEDQRQHRLSYVVVVVKQPFLYGICKEYYLRGDPGDDRFPMVRYQKSDAQPWGAEEVYRQLDEEGAEKNSFLLCYENRIVLIHFKWEPTAEQMATVKEKLAS